MAGWRPALKWGIGIAVASRLALLVWLALVWLVVGERVGIPAHLHADPVAELPALEAPLSRAVFGVWRRWDGSHYLNLAQNGYRASDPGPTVFAPLTPAALRLMDVLTPGSVDVAALVFGTATLALALVLLYRVCEVYYGDPDLGRWSVMVLALLPLAFFYSAPMSEAIYLGMALGVFYAGARRRWWLAAVFGALATLARSQGVILLGIAGLMLLEDAYQRCHTWPSRVGYVVRHGWPLVLIPLALVGFLAFRHRLGLPPLDEIYRTHSYVFFVNPLEGLFINLRWPIEHPTDALFNPDSWALLVCAALFGLLLRDPRHSRPALLVYTLASLLVAVSKVNWEWGSTDRVLYSQSFARYTLTIFPFAVWLADRLRRASPRWQRLYVALSGLGLVVFSALFALGGGAP
ncbi:MAG: hypothetical protein HZC41_25295 [Chloroflexi bacterium]|nr:hypothetical protein [Chloroflexota bacterium]